MADIPIPQSDIIERIVDRPAVLENLDPADEAIVKKHNELANERMGVGTVFRFSGTPGSVLFVDTDGLSTEDNENFFWDDTNNRLGIGTKTPSDTLHIVTAINSGGAIVQGTTASGINAAWSIFKDGTQLAEFGGAVQSQAFNTNSLANDVIIRTLVAGSRLLLNSVSNTIFTFGLDQLEVEKARITSDGRLGIGTASPIVALHVVTEALGQAIVHDNHQATPSPGFITRGSRGSIGSPSAILANDSIGFWAGRGWHSGGAFGGTSGLFSIKATENFTSTAQGTYLTFETTPAGSTTRAERVRITAAGNVLIGTITSPTTGTAGLVFGDGTALATMASNTAGLYANDVGGTVTMFAIDEANVSTQLGPWATFTPTLTNVANLDASTSFQAQYVRMGNVVIVSGKVEVDPTLTATSTQLGISLPITSNIGAVEDCSGTAFSPTIAGQGAAILGDVANNRAQMEWIAGDVTNQPMHFIFSYEVI